MSNRVPEYTVLEEVLHAITHGVGVLLSIFGLSWMLYLSIGAEDPWRIVASSIYGATLITLFLASTVYHGMYASRHREIFKLLDHCAIYLLIAGTYTPFLLVAMRNNTGWWLFGTIWALATAGIIKSDGERLEAVALPPSYDPTQGELSVHVDPSLAAGMTAGLDYLEHFPYECTEQTVSRFLPNVVTYRAYKDLGLDRPDLVIWWNES